MIIFKRFLIVNEFDNSSIKGIIKLERIKENLLLETRFAGVNSFDLVLKLENKTLFFESKGFDQFKLETMEIDGDIQSIVIIDNKIVATGATIQECNYKELYNDYLMEKSKNKNVQKDEIAEECEIKSESKTIKPIFYEKIKNKLEELFSTHEKEEDLESFIENSRWVKIKIPDDDYYVVGIIYKDDIPLSICYGIPGTDSKTPPVNEKMEWLSIGNKGYWIMCQSAIDGKNINW